MTAEETDAGAGFWEMIERLSPPRPRPDVLGLYWLVQLERARLLRAALALLRLSAAGEPNTCG